MNSANVFVICQNAGNPIHREQAFLGFPFVVLQQMFEIAVRLMQVQHQRMIQGVRHGSASS